MPHPRLGGMTREDLLRAADRITPGKIQKWSVAIGGREFPVRQLGIEAGNSLLISAPALTPADFTSHQVVRKLRDLGFEVKYNG